MECERSGSGVETKGGLFEGFLGFGRSFVWLENEWRRCVDEVVMRAETDRGWETELRQCKDGLRAEWKRG